MLPKISIVTPSYNQGQFLEETIASVVGQHYPNLEYIVIDGGSTDNSVDVINKQRNELTYWVSERDKGQSEAINKGFRRATGDILAWLNSDDMYMPGALFAMAELYNKHGDGLYFGNTIHFQVSEKHGLKCTGSNVVHAGHRSELANYDYIIQPSSFWTRRVWETAGELSEDFHYGFDWEWFLRCQKKHNIAFFPFSQPLSLYRIHDSHKTGTGGRKRQEELLKVYSIYSEKYARLYRLLMEEDVQRNSFLIKLLVTSSKVIKHPGSYASWLKTIKPRKYGEFTTSEIAGCLQML